ncbi:MAG: hypothetical protein ACREX7_09075, partial [Casimicrobiaceae bacterium]
VFTVRGAGQDAMRVIIEPALPVAGGGDGDDALQRATHAFGVSLERHVRRHPTEWRDWKKLKLPPDRASASERMAPR